ncbi:hypothetical protein CJF31_00009495 [Rutstroemia sp. NJR-2017a BVV2]|nr:hypothetical protein CJF31_00009495 [Rutstroemia sp. NJR-2017a BVV2]
MQLRPQAATHVRNHGQHDDGQQHFNQEQLPSSCISTKRVYTCYLHGHDEDIRAWGIVAVAGARNNSDATRQRPETILRKNALKVAHPRILLFHLQHHTNSCTENIFLGQNPILDQLEAKYNLERKRREARSRSGKHGKYNASKYYGTSSRRSPRPIRYTDSRARSTSSTKIPRSTKRRPKKRRNRDDSSDDEDSDMDTSDSDSDDESDSDSDSDNEVGRRSKSRSGKRRPVKKGRKPKKRKDDDSDEDEEDSDDEDDDDEDDDDDDSDEEEVGKKKKKKGAAGKKLKKGKNEESGEEEALSTKNKKSNSKKDAEDDEVGLLAKEDDDDNDEGKTYSDSEYEDSDTTAVATDKDSKGKGKGKDKESEVKGSEDGKPNPYRFVNRSSAFLKDQPRKGSSSSSIRARARATPSERASMRQQEIDQRRRQRQGRDAATKKSRPFGLEDDDDWSDTDASSAAPSTRSGRSSRLSSLFAPRNRTATPDPPSHKMADISPLPRSAVGSPRSQTTRSPLNPFTGSPLNNPFTASPLGQSARSPLAQSIISPKQSVARISPLQDITSDDALPKNPEPAETVITPPPAVHQPAEPSMVPVMIIERGKREIQWKPADGKRKKPGDIEMIFGGPAI